ncbi:hypothetical protein AHiyo8_19890 [Arthrobacter sp. Hiyo8]|jgi:hypothetical protein|nr:hypothetical protein [Arthrobacter bambusae]BAS13686.1 hypothetical protein AHiyo8_19890 [Arthrobacter sp. Hiyo8]GAP58466.1 hypothetical protein AHiyo1_15310 [Arthrobacter sp. Hiyo1]
MSARPKFPTPKTVWGRLYLYVASVGGMWTAQWLLYCATSGWSPEPTLASLVMFSIIFLFLVLAII